MDFVRVMVTAAMLISQAASSTDPFVGNWKQNNGKSFYSDPYSATIRIESIGVNRVRITQDVVRTAADNAAGRKEHSVNEYTLDGSEVHPSGTGGDVTQRLPESTSFRRISSNVWERVSIRPGDERHGYWAVSNDGRMLVITSFGKRESGEYYAQRVLEKQ